MEPVPKGLKALNWITGALFVVALYMVLFFAPREAVMGDVQRVFYFHVAVGWVGALAFLVTAITGAKKRTMYKATTKSAPVIQLRALRLLGIGSIGIPPFLEGIGDQGLGIRKIFYNNPNPRSLIPNPLHSSTT